MAKARRKINGNTERFLPGYKGVNNFLTEYQKPADNNGDRLVFVGPTIRNKSSKEARITVMKLNKSRDREQQLRIINL